MVSLKKILVENKIRWDFPILEEESNSFINASQELEIHHSDLLEAYKNGKILPLSSKNWDKLQNTDSTKVTSFLDIVETIQKYQKNDPDYSRDWKSIKEGYKTGNMKAPIIAITKNGHYLIEGNARLMVAKAMGIKPWAYQFVVRG